MRILAAVSHILAEGIIWAFYGGFTLAVIGGINGVLHGVVFNVLVFPFRAVNLEAAFFLCCLGGLGGVSVGAVVGAAVLGLAGLHRSLLCEFRFTPRFEVDFMVNAAGATQAGFACSFAGASTGAIGGFIWGVTAQPFGNRVVDAFAAGYVVGAIFGFTLGAFVGAMVPERVAHVREQIQNARNRRQRPLRGAEDNTP